MHDLKLTVGGRDFGGWKSARVSRSIETIAGSFELSVSEIWPGQDPARDLVKIKAGDTCALKVDGETVITGFVDELQLSHDAKSHQVTLAGRDATGDLVDCSAIHKTGRWENFTMQGIASDLCKPFGIEVRVDTDTGKRLPHWSINEGETVFACLERLARDRGVLLVSDGGGGLVITRAGSDRAMPLSLGKNILSAEAALSFRDRYSLYIAMAQGTGLDDGSASAAWIRPKQTVVDPTMAESRSRPLIVIHDGYVTGGVTLAARAQWEANVRAGRSVDVRVKVQGWTQGGDTTALWQPNHIAHVVHPELRLDSDMLIKGVEFVLDEGGTITELALTDPFAFTLIPMPNNPDNWMSLARTAKPTASGLPEQLGGPLA